MAYAVSRVRRPIRVLLRDRLFSNRIRRRSPDAMYAICRQLISLRVHRLRSGGVDFTEQFSFSYIEQNKLVP